MKYFFVFVLAFLPHGHGEGFFSKLMNHGKRDSNSKNEDFVDVCKTVRVMPRIAMAVVGGAPLKAEFSAPYIAAVGERLSNGSVSWFCGGSLVSANDILTAAHCLVSRNVSTIRLGSFSTKTRSTENDYEILETIIHPGYKITESYNDIAIIKVKDKISFSKNIKPVCLPQEDNETFERERARVVGWGAEEFGGEGSQKLQQVEVEIFSNANCEKAYQNSTIAPKTFPKGIKKEQLCAGSSKGGKDACQGDSGGPLVLTDEKGIVRQIGIVSTGAGCGFKMYPGVYARVSSYTDWIEKQINKPATSTTPSSQGSRNSTKTSNQQSSSNHNNNSGSSSTKKETSTKPSSMSINHSPSQQKNRDGYNTTSIRNSQNTNTQNSRDLPSHYSRNGPSPQYETLHNNRPDNQNYRNSGAISRERLS